jgi:hypothetical protein
MSVKEMDGCTVLLDYELKCCIRFTASNVTCIQHLFFRWCNHVGYWEKSPLKPQDRFDSVDIACKSEYKFLGVYYERKYELECSFEITKLKFWENILHYKVFKYLLIFRTIWGMV